MNKIKKLLHDWLGWGFIDTTKSRNSDGFQPTFGCQFCDKQIAQDSQRNWFHLS